MRVAGQPACMRSLVQELDLLKSNFDRISSPLVGEGRVRGY